MLILISTKMDVHKIDWEEAIVKKKMGRSIKRNKEDLDLDGYDMRLSNLCNFHLPVVSFYWIYERSLNFIVSDDSF